MFCVLYTISLFTAKKRSKQKQKTKTKQDEHPSVLIHLFLLRIVYSNVYLTDDTTFLLLSLKEEKDTIS